MLKKFSPFLFIGLLLASLSVLLNFTLMPKDKYVEDFSLMNVNGKRVSLKDYPNAKGFILVFTCNHCPFAKLYPDRMNALNKKYKPLGVPLIAISSTDTLVFEEDTYVKMTEKAKAEHFNYPYLYDADQTVAKNVGADKTPHAFVIWKEHGKYVVHYNGAIDDNGAEPEHVSVSYISEAADALLKGKPIQVRQTKSIGCQIHFRK